MSSKIEIICAGLGGQGVLFLGRTLATIMALAKRGNVVEFEFYSAEQRGNISIAEILYSKNGEDIFQTRVEKADYIILLHPKALIKPVRDTISSSTLIILNSSLKGYSIPKSISCVKIPALELALKNSGTWRVMNMVMLGAFIELTRMMTISDVVAYLKKTMHGHAMLEANIKAVLAGYKYARNSLPSITRPNP